MAAVGINRMKRMPKKVMMNITNFPMVNPEIVTGVSMMLLFVLRQSACSAAKASAWLSLHHRAHHVLPAVCHPVRYCRSCAR